MKFLSCCAGLSSRIGIASFVAMHCAKRSKDSGVFAKMTKPQCGACLPMRVLQGPHGFYRDLVCWIVCHDRRRVASRCPYLPRMISQGRPRSWRSATRYSRPSIRLPSGLSMPGPKAAKAVAQQIFEEIDGIADQRFTCSKVFDDTKLEARSRISGKNLFVVLLVSLHPNRSSESSTCKAGFTAPSEACVTSGKARRTHD